MSFEQKYKKSLNSLIQYTKKRLALKQIPEIKFVEDQENSDMLLGKTSFYRPNQKTITVFITDRHPKDIMRSLVHEIVHYEQDYRHNLSDEHKKNLKDKQYAQHDSILRQLEEDAYLRGNIIFRDWEDSVKNKTIKIKIIH